MLKKSLYLYLMSLYSAFFSTKLSKKNSLQV